MEDLYLFFGFAVIAGFIALGFFSSINASDSTQGVDVVVSLSEDGALRHVSSQNAQLQAIRNASPVINFSPSDIDEYAYFSVQGIECQLSCAKKEQKED